MAVEQDPMVIVLEPTVLGLVQHLAPRGLQVHPNDVRSKINQGVSRDWGTSKAKRFTDANGGGWLIDLSDYFGNEMLYAVVRSGPNGTRAAVAVVEADDIEELQRTGKPLPGLDGEETLPEVAESPRAAAVRTASAPAKPPAKPESPADPMLILVMNERCDHTGVLPSGTKTNASGPPVENIIRTTRGEMSDVVSKLLQDGIRPEHVEIWSGCRKPKVQIAFE